MKFSQLPLLSAAAISLFAFSTFAQQTADGPPNLSDALSSQASEKSAETATSAPTSSGTRRITGTSTGPSPTGKITGGGSAAATTGSVPAISITGGGTQTAGGALTGLPTLSGAFKVVAPTVPPTADAPFMRTSSLPEGTVFIVVGAVLGFMAMSVVLWRGLVAWSLHRSVKRAALSQNMTDTKAHFRTPAPPIYSYKDRESTLSLGNMGQKKNKSRPTTALGGTPQASLFFSPTAGAAGQGMNSAGNRGSNYLPAGYYAAGASQPGNGNGMTHIGSGPSISLANLGPQRDGYARAQSIGPTPPGTPPFRAHLHAASASTLNLNQPPGDQRAPSVYLDDLFDREDGHVAPGSNVYGGQERL